MTANKNMNTPPTYGRMARAMTAMTGGALTALFAGIFAIDACDRQVNETGNPNYNVVTDTFNRVDVTCPSTESATLAPQTIMKTFNDVKLDRRPDNARLAAVITEKSGQSYSVSSDCTVTWKF